MDADHTEMLQSLITAIDRFDEKCGAEEGTDSQEAWDLLNSIRTVAKLMVGDNPTPLTVARTHWVNDKHRDLFAAEIANERNGGESPATLSSTIDSISQAVDIMCEGWEPDDFVALLMICDLVGTDTEVEDLL